MKDFLRRASGLAVVESLLCAPCLWGDGVQEASRQARVVEEPVLEQAESPGREPGGDGDGVLEASRQARVVEEPVSEQAESSGSRLGREASGSQAVGVHGRILNRSG